MAATLQRGNRSADAPASRQMDAGALARSKKSDRRANASDHRQRKAERGTSGVFAVRVHVIVMCHLSPDITHKNFGVIDFMLIYRSVEQIITKIGTKKYNERTVRSLLG